MNMGMPTPAANSGSAVHRGSGGYNEIAGDVSGEDVAEGKKASEVNHSSDDAQQRRKPLFQSRQFARVICRLAYLSWRAGTSSKHWHTRILMISLGANGG
jgi:hypothetical protein